jgi:nicotinate-nucleotide adenylyltransferase
MVVLACRGESKFEASRLEQGTLSSYSIDTIEKVRARLGAGDELFFLIGADAFAEIQTWRRWPDVIRAVEFIVVSRPGHCYNIPEGARVHRLETVELPVSSSEIRRRLASGDDRVEVPAAVLTYIRERGLYRTE